MLSFPDFKEKQIIVIFGNEGQTLKIKNSNILIQNHEKETLLQHSLHKILNIWIIGRITLSSVVLEKAQRYGIALVLLSQTFKPLGFWGNKTEGNTLLRSKQYQTNSHEYGKKIINNKINNQLILLKSIRKKTTNLKSDICEIQSKKKQIQNTESLQGLMGLEGYTTKIYFKHWFATIGWKGRKPRTKIDINNVLLDMGYTYLFNFIETLLCLHGFDIYKGIYHQFFYQRKSLVCDIIEPFRCIIEHALKKAYNLKQIHATDFTYQNQRYTLQFKKSKSYTKIFLDSILLHKNEIYRYIQSYYRYELAPHADKKPFPSYEFKHTPPC